VTGPDLSPYGATGQPFNEIVVDARGRAWVDMPGSMPWEDPKPGTVTVVLPDGSSRQVADDVWFPNGMVVLGEDTLVLAESHRDRLTARAMRRRRRCDLVCQRSRSALYACRRRWQGAGNGHR